MQNCNMAFRISHITLGEIRIWTRFVFSFHFSVGMKCSHQSVSSQNHISVIIISVTFSVNQPCSTFALWSALARGGLVTDAAFGGKTVLLQPLVLHGIFCTAEKHSPIRARSHWTRRCCEMLVRPFGGCTFEPRQWGGGAHAVAKRDAAGLLWNFETESTSGEMQRDVTLRWPIK